MSLGKKILYGSIIVFGGCYFTIAFFSRIVTEDLSNQIPYSKCIGKKFILKEDMYAFKDHDSSNLSIAGSNSGINGLPHAVNDELLKNYGDKNQYLKIYGIIKKGSIFTIKKVIEERSFENSLLEFIIIFESCDILDTSFLINWANYPFIENLGDPPIFKANLVEPLPSDGIWWK